MPLDLLKNVPCFLGDLLREAIEKPTASGRVDHAVQMGFLLQDQQRVAGDAAAEIVRQPDQRVEGRGSDRLGPTDTGREDADRIAQEVDVRIAPGKHSPACPGVNAHRTCGR